MTDTSEPTEQTTNEIANLEDDPLTRERLAKYRKVLEEGGFPYAFERSSTAAELHAEFADLEPGAETGNVVTVAGRLMNTREMGKLAFGVLSDATGKIQLFVDKRKLGDEGFAGFLDLDAGDWIGATGEVITSKRGELSVRIDSFSLLQKSLRPMPDKWHGLKDIEARSRHRYIDLLANEAARATAIARARIISELRRQFEDRGYIEVETPVLLSEATGATATPVRNAPQRPR